MTPRHLIADLQFAFDGDEHFDHLDDARRQFIAALEPVDLAFKNLFDRLDLLLSAVDDAVQLRLGGFAFDPNLAPIAHRQLIEIVFSQLLALIKQNFAIIVR